MNSISNHITYLDTMGRPTIKLQYKQLTDRHVGTIYVCSARNLSFCSRLTIILPTLGRVQGPLLGSSQETACCLGSIHESLRPCLCMEAR